MGTMNISQDGFFLPSPPPPTTINGFHQSHQERYSIPNPNPNPNPDISCAGTNNKRKWNSTRTPDLDKEVVALSPKSLMATYRYICEICNKGFQRDQNLQLHRRGHNLPWKLKQRASKDQMKKKVYICPEVSCVNHDPSRALGDLTGIKKHYSRKHGEKKWNCDNCSKKYAVLSDWKAHRKICGTRQYKCNCGTIFSRKDSFITHRAFCDTLTEERMRIDTSIAATTSLNWNFRSELINASLMNAPQSVASGIFSFPVSQRPGFLGNFEPSSSNGSKNMGAQGLINNPRLPLWLDHQHITALPKGEEEINRPIFHTESLISNNNSTLFASAFNNGDTTLHQTHLFRQHMNSQLAAGEQGFETRNEISINSGTSVGMRDFLSGLGGEAGNNGGKQGERRVFMQDGIAYQIATVAGSHDHHHQEPYMNLMR